MTNIYKTQDVVKEVLELHPATRNSDNQLYVEVCRRVNPGILGKSFGYVFTHSNDLNIPCFETVRRTRQKLQALNPALAADNTVETFRALNEREYLEYARRKW